MNAITGLPRRGFHLRWLPMFTAIALGAFRAGASAGQIEGIDAPVELPPFVVASRSGSAVSVNPHDLIGTWCASTFLVIASGRLYFDFQADGTMNVVVMARVWWQRHYLLARCRWKIEGSRVRIVRIVSGGDIPWRTGLAAIGVHSVNHDRLSLLLDGSANPPIPLRRVTGIPERYATQVEALVPIAVK